MVIADQTRPQAQTPFDDSLRALEAVYPLAREYLTGLSARPVGRPCRPEEMAALLDEPLPEQASDPAAAALEWFRRAEPGVVASAGPRFFGYVLGGTTPAALAGDWLASTLDQNGGLWASSPAAAQTELVVIRWLKELFHLPADWSGVLTSGATMANLVGLAAGRQWAGEKLGFDPGNDGLGGHPAINVVSSTAIHASAIKSLGTLGLGRKSIRLVPAPDGRVDLAALKAELATIDGPAIIVANAGEVNTGQFEDIVAIAGLRDRHPGGAWLHVDGAFGLFAAATPRFRHLLTGVERADSVGSDGHKWLNVPYDCGFAFVRDADVLKRAFVSKGAYIAGSGGWDADDLSPEMSRRFRGLAAWCALKAYGRAGYREMIERCLDYAADFAGWVTNTPGLELMNAELMAENPFNIVCFRFVPSGLDDAATDALNRAAIAAIQADGRVFITGTVWNGRTALRAAFDNWSTATGDVAILKEAIADIGGRLTRG